ncbi:uncharacterized protein LOC142490667 [Ascaphus truei]|uniref:uncharacterized protein LOC142490667 n=1 Tax=Ascaphus truei TaxID=8439 RepID=UPI003F5A376D
MWDTIVIGVNACGNHVRDKRNCHKRFDDIRSKLKKKIQHQRVHATGTGGGPTPQRLILSPLEELLRAKLLPVVVEGLPGDRDIGIYPSQFPPVAPEGHVSPETEQVSSPGSASSTHLEEHDEEDYDDDDDDDDAAATIDTQIQASDHEEVPIETVLPPNRPANTTYDAIVASEGKIVEAENRRHSDLMTVLERMIALQEETVSQLAHLHRVFIEVPKQLQKINTSFEALVVQQTQANYLRMTNVSQFNINTSQAGSVHAGQFSPNSSDLHSPALNKDQLNVLGRGLSFSKTCGPSSFQLFKDLHKFTRNITLKRHFLKHDRDLVSDKAAMVSSGDIKHNLSASESLALKTLRDDESLIIRQADKGGGVVVQNMCDYEKEALRLLNDTTSYVKLPKDPTAEYLRVLKALLDNAVALSVINTTEFAFLFSEFPRIPIFYHLPKIHKALVDPPGRPIVSDPNIQEAPVIGKKEKT